MHCLSAKFAPGLAHLSIVPATYPFLSVHLLSLISCLEISFYQWMNLFRILLRDTNYQPKANLICLTFVQCSAKSRYLLHNTSSKSNFRGCCENEKQNLRRRIFDPLRVSYDKLYMWYSYSRERFTNKRLYCFAYQNWKFTIKNYAD